MRLKKFKWRKREGEVVGRKYSPKIVWCRQSFRLVLLWLYCTVYNIEKVKKKNHFFSLNDSQWNDFIVRENLCVVTSEAGPGCGWDRGEKRGGATAGSCHRQPINTLDYSYIRSANKRAGFIALVTDSQSTTWILFNQPIREQDSLLLSQTANQHPGFYSNSQ